MSFACRGILLLAGRHRPQHDPQIVREPEGPGKLEEGADHERHHEHDLQFPHENCRLADKGELLDSLRVGGCRLVSTDYIRDMADLAEKHCGGYLRFTSRHNVEFLVSDKGKLEPLKADLKKLNLPHVHFWQQL